MTKDKVFAILFVSPFLMVLGLIIDAKVDFYLITQTISIYDYEVVLLLLLLAPFIYSLPSTSQTALMLARKAYWFVFIAFVMLIMLGILIMFATSQV
jgi:hypothetical protein